MFVTGIIFIPVGAITALFGGLILAVSTSVSSACTDLCDSSSGSGSSTGAAVLAVGGVMLVGGIVMTVIGGKKVPANEALLLDPRHSPPTPKASVTPLFGPMSGVRVQF